MLLMLSVVKELVRRRTVAFIPKKRKIEMCLELSALELQRSVSTCPDTLEGKTWRETWAEIVTRSV